MMLILLLVSALCPLASPARILGMLPFWAKSHQAFLQPVLRTLAEAGHEVVVYSPFPPNDPPPNYTHVQLDGITTESEELTNWFLAITEAPHYKCFEVVLEIYKSMYKEFVGEQRIKELLASKERFDLIITEAFTAQDYTLIVAGKFKAPVIVLQAFPTNHIVNINSGNSLSMSFIPGLCAPYSDNMSFLERLVNSFTTLKDLYYYYNYQLRGTQERMRKDFPDMPPLEELVKRVSLVLVNDHLTADYAQPRTPNVIPVGGIHIRPSRPLPPAIKKFAEEAKEGLILFSLGTYVQDELQPQQYFDMYINVFKNLKQRVIWKTRKEGILGLPNNVMTVKWAPQQDILAHPHCVLFITHGGLLSQHETLHFGVPVVGIPQFYDQHRNVRYFVEKGVGVKVGREEVSEATMSAAIREVLENPRYLQR